MYGRGLARLESSSKRCVSANDSGSSLLILGVFVTSACGSTVLGTVLTLHNRTFNSQKIALNSLKFKDGSMSS